MNRLNLSDAEHALLSAVNVALTDFRDFVEAVVRGDTNVHEVFNNTLRRFEREAPRDASEEPVFLFGALLHRAVAFAQKKAV